MIRSTVMFVVVALATTLVPSTALAQDGGLSEPLREALLRSLDRAETYLMERRADNGVWENHAGITALAAAALIEREGADRAEQVRRLRPTLDYLAGLAKPDGGIYERDTPHYVTAVSVLALLATEDARYEETIENARLYLADSLVDEGEGYNVDDQFYGGVGYGSDLRPDMSNVELALRALKESGTPDDSELWDKALNFIQRTQNSSETNDLDWAADDGGFVYYPGFTYAVAGGTTSYGSMTYAGLLSYSYANVDKGDERVQAALDWIREHYTVDENPNIEQKTVYYYYMVFAKALQAWGEDVIVDANGQAHNWREDLGRKLLELQYDEGYWVNLADPDYMQDNEVLITAFTMTAIEYLLR
jgi:squalene-hopene/tetraprenyl-beta-curcumene cyclase